MLTLFANLYFFTNQFVKVKINILIKYSISFFLLILSAGSTAAQIDYDILSGPQKGQFDSLAHQTRERLAPESEGLLEKEIDPAEYVLGPGDVLDLLILTTEPRQYSLKVSAQGRLLIPEVGMVNLKNKTLAEAENLIRTVVKKTYNVDEIYVDLSQLRKFKLSIIGEVLKTGMVSASAVDRVSEVIDRSGGLDTDASWRKIKILRDNGNIIPVDLVRYFLLNENNANPFVNGGDQIIVPPRNDDYTIEITGEVASPGNFEFVEGDSLSTIIKFAMGFLESAFLDSVEIARYELKSNSTYSFYVDISSWHAEIFNKYNLKNDIPLLPGDQVFIRKNADWYDTKYVSISGEVKYPGRYPLTKDSLRITDLINMSGGLKENASLDNSKLIRVSQLWDLNPELGRLSKVPVDQMSEQEEKYYRAHFREKKGQVSVDFVKLYKENDPQENVILRHNDSLYIAPQVHFVNVQGFVRKPGLVPYQKELDYLDYIELAGGFGYQADESEVMIEKQNGQIFHADSERYLLQPGDKIIVPPEAEKDIFLTGLTVTTQIMTILGVVVALINLR